MITKEEFDSLYSDEITKKQYDEIVNRINLRFVEICNKFLRKKNKTAWFDYGNASYDYSDDINGYFNPQLYQDYVGILGESIEPPPGYGYEFPTRWLWEEHWEAEMKAEVALIEDVKLKKKEQQAKRKEYLATLRESIKSKLTSEELKVIKFK